MAKTNIEADFLVVPQPDLLSSYSDLQQQHKKKCLMVAMLTAAGLGEVTHYKSVHVELVATGPAWPKTTSFTAVMLFIFSYVHQTLLVTIFERRALPLTLKQLK